MRYAILSIKRLLYFIVVQEGCDRQTIVKGQKAFFTKHFGVC